MTPILVNLGCGMTFHRDWVNLDVNPRVPEVRRWDVRAGLPFDEGTVDAVYASHLLEHIEPDLATKLLTDLRRILRPGGVLRLAVPDLENQCRAYLDALGEAWASPGDAQAVLRYRWMVVELLDQLVRVRSGGEMGSMLTTVTEQDRPFIRARIGMEADNYWNRSGMTSREKLMERVRQNGLGWLFGKLRHRMAEVVVGIVGGASARSALREGYFRQSGELHRWMYDRTSLRALLSESGYVEFVVCRPDQSDIPGFTDYQLDMEKGVVRKPDSIFVECRKG